MKPGRGRNTQDFKGVPLLVLFSSIKEKRTTFTLIVQVFERIAIGILRVNILRAGDDAVVDVHIPAAVHSALIEPEQVCTVLIISAEEKKVNSKCTRDLLPLYFIESFDQSVKAFISHS